MDAWSKRKNTTKPNAHSIFILFLIKGWYHVCLTVKIEAVVLLNSFYWLQNTVILLTHHRDINIFFQLRWTQQVAASIHTTHCLVGSAPSDRSLLCLCVGVRKFGIELCFLPVRPGSPPPHGGWLTHSLLSCSAPLQDACRITLGLLGHYVKPYQRIINGKFHSGYMMLEELWCDLTWILL